MRERKKRTQTEINQKKGWKRKNKVVFVVILLAGLPQIFHNRKVAYVEIQSIYRCQFFNCFAAKI